jgi:hypothetical protein
MSEFNRTLGRSALLAAFLTAACGADIDGAPADGEPAQDAVASATTDRAAVTSANELGERHCVVNEGGEPVCFGSFRTALSYATGGAKPAAIRAAGDESLATLVALHPLGAEDLPSQPMLTTQSSVVLAILYEHADYRGNSWIIQSSADCRSGPFKGLYFKKGDYWNDRISSLRVYAGCTVTLFENNPCTGTQVSFASSTNYVGRAMNDQTSCVYIREL